MGPQAEHAFSEAPATQRVSGPNFALAVFSGVVRTPTLSLDTSGNARAETGDTSEAGCSATIARDGATVTLACDPFGLHGVFMARVRAPAEEKVGASPAETFWFASDLTLLRQIARLPATLRPSALHGYLCFSYVPMPTTLFAAIDALPAGSRTTFSIGVQQATPADPPRLWHEAPPFLTKEEDAVVVLRQKLRGAVARQLNGEREVGVFLSGGLDSSLVAALLIEAGARVQLYTLDFGSPYDAELPAARKVAAYLKQPLTVVPARSREIAQALQATAQAMQQPFGDAVTVPLTLLGEAAASRVATVFNGEFGDQLFGGWANKPMIAAELYSAPEYRRATAYLTTFHRFHGLTNTLYTPWMQQATMDVETEAWIQAEMETGDFTGLLHRLRAANLQLKGAQNIGPRSRQLAEACGLRSQSPFCDRELAAWTFTCPPEWFLQGACEKYLLKRAAEPFLPSSIVWREKRGMGVPVTEWCLGGLRRTIARTLHPRRLKHDGWFQPAAIQTLRRGSDQPGEFRTRRLGEKLWTLLLLHVWLDARTGPAAGVGKGYREATHEMYSLQHGE